MAAKSRSVLVGWKDPMIYQLERAAPTPTQIGIMVTLQWFGISKGDRPHSRFDQCIRTGSQDIKKKQTCHETAIRRVTHPKVVPGQLLRVETEIYGRDNSMTSIVCGKAIDLRLAGQEGTRFAGRRVVQHPDFRITVSMDEYVKSKLRPIEVPRGYQSKHQGDK